MVRVDVFANEGGGWQRRELRLRAEEEPSSMQVSGESMNVRREAGWGRGDEGNIV